jgi:hypothetical protein
LASNPYGAPYQGTPNGRTRFARVVDPM